uniref:SRCR domain-containing protein n=1 Tax=Sinocyclocheilus grahami TaxID=75366 RepID=A0A672P0R7_SINGR
MRLSIFFVLSVQYTVSVNVRLVGGHSRCAGTVEVLHRGQWGTVCDEDWDMADAAVVCRELDCGEPVDVLGAAAFGKGDAQMWTQEIQCRGNESQIHLCAWCVESWTVENL